MQAESHTVAAPGHPAVVHEALLTMTRVSVRVRVIAFVRVRVRVKVRVSTPRGSARGRRGSVPLGSVRDYAPG